jgi:uncharacterized membrane protein YkoI
MTELKPKYKRLFVVSGFAVAAIAAIAVALYIPYTASAQQVMTSQPPYWMGDGSQMANSFYGSGNRTHMMAMPNITGSVNIPKLISDQVKVSFSDAAKTAEEHVDGGKVMGGHIGIVQGYLVYSFMVANPDNQTCYMVIVDAGNGSVLYKSEGFQMGSFGNHFGFGGGPMAMHKFGGMMAGLHHG